MVDPDQVLKQDYDNMCRCRGCTVSRKKAVKDVLDIINNLDTKEQIMDAILQYKERNKL